LLDEVGIDIGSKIAPILEKELGDRFKAPDAFNRLIDSKRLGRKTGRGFYKYDKKGKKVDESVYELLGVTPSPRLNKKEIADRCVSLMLNEAVRCLDEGIIANERDGDIGAIFGIGFPPFLGGPFTYMNKMGIENLCSQLATFANDNPVFTPAECLMPAETAKPELEVVAEAEEVKVEVEPEAVKADESSAEDNLKASEKPA
jgi:3-hydroxyacyl-CoA dehydrogenase/enoyl-CoA hydratase/3-hydroxybutyryl-CoA epimerase